MSPAERQRIREHAAELVADWPPLTAGQRSRVSLLLTGGRGTTATSTTALPARPAGAAEDAGAA